MFKLGSIMILSLMLLVAATAPAQQLKKITMSLSRSYPIP